MPLNENQRNHLKSLVTAMLAQDLKEAKARRAIPGPRREDNPGSDLRRYLNSLGFTVQDIIDLPTWDDVDQFLAAVEAHPAVNSPEPQHS